MIRLDVCTIFVKHDLKESVEVFMGRNLDSLPPHRPAKLPLTYVTDRINDSSQTLPTAQIPPYKGHRYIKRVVIQKSDV